MKRQLLFILFFQSLFYFTSCDKNKEFIHYSEYYHRDADTTYSYILIPNSFTPGKDGINDYFNPIVVGIPFNKFEITIFTRNNETVYYSKDNHILWDGTKFGEELSNGVYFYEIIAIDFYGYLYNINGQVNILR